MFVRLGQSGPDLANIDQHWSKFGRDWRPARDTLKFRLLLEYVRGVSPQTGAAENRRLVPNVDSAAPVSGQATHAYPKSARRILLEHSLTNFHPSAAEVGRN